MTIKLDKETVIRELDQNEEQKYFGTKERQRIEPATVKEKK